MDAGWLLAGAWTMSWELTQLTVVSHQAFYTSLTPHSFLSFFPCLCLSFHTVSCHSFIFFSFLPSLVMDNT